MFSWMCKVFHRKTVFDPEASDVGPKLQVEKRVISALQTTTPIIEEWALNLYPEFASLVNEFLMRCKESALNIRVCQSFRSFADQDYLYSLGRTRQGNKVTKAKGGQSWHNYGLAVDVCFRKDPFSEKHPWNTLGKIGKECGLEWGGDWTLPDRPHFQWPAIIDLKTAQRLYHQNGLNAVWEALK